MAKLSSKTAATVLDATDDMPINQDTGSTPVSKRSALSLLRTFLAPIRAITFVFSLPGDGSMSPPVSIPVSGTIIGWSLVTENDTDDVVLDIWKDTTVPDASDTIVASAPPTGSGVVNSTTLTGWTTSVAANDVFRAEVTTASDASSVTLVLKIRESY